MSSLDMGIHARIAGSVQIDGSGAPRDVIVISDSPSGRQVLASGSSDGLGAFDIDFNGYAGPVIAIALDKYGETFATGAAYSLGKLVHPTTPNGYVFQVTAAGTTGATEPEWNTTGTTVSGGATFNAKPFYRPVASGPLLPEILGDSDPPPPWVHASTEYMASFARVKAVQYIPDCKAGDYLVIYGLRRTTINIPAGWTVVTAPAAPSSSSAPQWTYAAYRLADGSESGTFLEVTNTAGSSARLTLQVAVIRCPEGYTMTASHISSIRQPVGGVASTPLQVTNIDSRTLAMCLTSWIYSTAIDETWSYADISHASAQQLARNNRMWYGASIPSELRQIRGIGVIVEADPLEVITIGLSTENNNADDQRSDIWLAFATNP